MKIFNGRLATEEYMSTHSLTFSTPEMNLKKFALWLSEHVVNKEKNEELPRLFLYIEEKKNNNDGNSISNDNTKPDIDDTFRPTGAVIDMYKTIDSKPSDNRYCLECGNKLKGNSKFCINCGTKQG